jgi:hypothetical protein
LIPQSVKLLFDHGQIGSGLSDVRPIR